MREPAVRLLIALFASCAFAGCANPDRTSLSVAHPGSAAAPTAPRRPFTSEPILALLQKALDAQGKSKDRLLAVVGQEPTGVSPERYLWALEGPMKSKSLLWVFLDARGMVEGFYIKASIEPTTAGTLWNVIMGQTGGPEEVRYATYKVESALSLTAVEREKRVRRDPLHVWFTGRLANGLQVMLGQWGGDMGGFAPSEFHSLVFPVVSERRVNTETDKIEMSSPVLNPAFRWREVKTALHESWGSDGEITPQNPVEVSILAVPDLRKRYSLGRFGPGTPKVATGSSVALR
ncbi:MAG: hypothetical protein KIS66_17600 [Fimbriimonadaceae bacterium]|nr:hypothetical protein [Fimbriimonadaceae bacterium]